MARQAAQKGQESGEAQRARASGRTDPEDVMADLVAVVDMEVQRQKKKVESGQQLNPGESATLANFGRVLTQLIQAKGERKKKGKEADMTEEELQAELKRIREQTA
jgi:hypothetical protein